jgi:hypothetical protein
MTSFSFEPSGKMKLPSAQELAEADKDMAILAYSSGKAADGQAYWAYIAVTPSLYRSFHALSAAKQSLVLNDYGTVLEAGFGDAPPAEIMQAMKDDFGFDAGYTQKIVDDITGQQSAIAHNHEEQRLMDIVTMLKKKQS